LFLVPLLILVAGGLLTAWVNYERFGNPLTFVNLLEKERILADARRLHVERDLHPFEPVRLLPSFAYYFFGMPIARLWPQLTAAYYDDIGWPRSILLAKETLLIASAAIGFIALVKKVRAGGPWVPVIITGTGALIYILIMLGLPIINYRYQMDLQPEISFFAVLGYISLSRFVAAHTMRLPALICAILLAANIGISHLDLLQAKFSSFALGPTSRERVYKMTYPVSALFANAE
jgi:hypothetical protein